MLPNAFRSIDRTVEFALFLIFLVFTLVGGLQVFNRFVLGLPLSWSEEFQKFGHIWMVMLAIPVAYRRGAHLGMDMLLRLLPSRAQRAVGLLTEVLWRVIGLAGILATPSLVPALFPQKMFAMLDNFSLLALPYFILAGELISAGGISKRLVEFGETVVGHWRGGLGHASVVSSMVFAGVSGSSVADTSAIGSILVPAMKDHGYKPGFAAALVACAGTIGAIIPPSMTMIVYGSMANVSIGGLFLGGIVPGVLIGIGLMIVIRIYSFAPAFPELRRTSGKFEPRRVMRPMLTAGPALPAPVIVVGRILTGAFTATEAGVVVCF